MATYYFRNSGTAWNTATNWSLSSGGPADGAVPTSADDVIFDASSGNCTVATTPGVCKTFNSTGYTGTLTLSTTLTVSGNVTFGSGMGTSGSGNNQFIVNNSATLTSNRNNVNFPFKLYNLNGNNNTYTLADDWTFNGLFLTGSQSGALTHTINGNNIYCKAGFNINTDSFSSASFTTGSTNIFVIGPGALTINGSSSNGLGNNLTINAPGSNLTVSSTFYYKTGTFTYIAGTFTTTSSTLGITGSCTLNMNSGGLNYLLPFSLSIIFTTTTITMSSDFYCKGYVSTQNTTINGSSLYISGNVSVSGGLSGTTILRIQSTSTISSTQNISNDVVLNAGSSTITLGDLYLIGRSGGTTWTWISGTISSGSSTMTISGPNQFNFNLSGTNASLNNLTITGSSFTVNLLSDLYINGILNFKNQQYTFTGAYNLSCGSLTYTSETAGTYAIGLTAGQTYTVRTNLQLNYSSTNFPIKSMTPGSVAYLVLNNNATQAVAYVTATDIDSSGGQTIRNFKGTLSNTNNWAYFTQPMNMVRTFVD